MIQLKLEQITGANLKSVQAINSFTLLHIEAIFTDESIKYPYFDNVLEREHFQSDHRCLASCLASNPEHHCSSCAG